MLVLITLWTAHAGAAGLEGLTGHVWEHLGPVPSSLPLSGIAVQPGHSATWVVADTSGALFLTTDGGGAWERVLDGVSLETTDDEPDDEHVLLDAEATPEAREEGETRASAAIREARTTGLAAAAASNPGRPWWHPAEPDVVLVGRPDGIWRSRDGGTVFQSVWDVAATSFAMGPEGIIIAGTDDGVLYSTDAGAHWIDVVDETDDIPVFQVIETSGQLFAATALGLYRSGDGVQWSVVSGLPWGAIPAVVADPFWKGGLWAATSSGLMRTDDGGTNFYAAGRQPMRGLRGLAHRGVAGELVAWGTDGVWASGDGGVSWSPQVRLLTEPDVRDLAAVDGQLVIATASGLWRYVKPEEPEQLVVRHEKVLSLGETVSLAVNRPGINTSVLSLAHRSNAVKFLPGLEAGYSWSSHESRTAALIDGTTDEPNGSDWEVFARLCWGGCSSTSYSGDTSTDELSDAISAARDAGEDVTAAAEEAAGDMSDIYAADDAVAAAADDMFVIGGNVYGGDDVTAAAANVAQQILRYQTRLGTEVAEAWSTRNRLAEERGLVSTQALQAQVLHELKIQEVDARLDLWTNGAFTRSIQITEDKP